MSEVTPKRDTIKDGVKTAAILLIGNEILSGKIKDENAFYLSQRLRQLGVSLEKISVVPDQRTVIAEEVQMMSQRFDHVFTSGGVGPTHDDITLESIAYAFDEVLVLDEDLHQLLKGYFKERLNDAHLRMAHIPSQSELIWYKEAKWPVYSYQNIYILPGVPQIFKAKFEAIAERFRAGAFFLRSVYLNTGEGAIAECLRRIEDRFDVCVGSYPNVQGHYGFNVRVTIESREAEQVNQAVNALVKELTDKVDNGELKVYSSQHKRRGKGRNRSRKSRHRRVKKDLSLIASIDPPVFAVSTAPDHP
jgi:molybdenum cofactor synthesis domain-containing protein